MEITRGGGSVLDGNQQQTFAKEGQHLNRKAGRYAHARQFKRMKRAIKRQRTIVGRLQREMERLIHPHSVGGAGMRARKLRSEGAHVAWVFFMLFAMSIAVIVAALTLVGIGFDPALILTIAALSTTGPLAQFAGEAPVRFAELGYDAKVILGCAMVLGRVEALAVLALLAPGQWRR